MSERGILVRIQGRDLYEWLQMPEVPRKGDVLWLGSLTRGRVDVPEVVVSKVEWAMDQSSGEVHVWVTVRRTAKRGEAGTE